MALSYLDLGYDQHLDRGFSFETDGGSLGLQDLANNPSLPSGLGSGEYNEHLTLGKDGYIIGGANGYDDGSGFFLGYRLANDDYGFFIGNSTGNKLTYNTTDDTLSVTGTIIASAGTIGGWVITATDLYALSSGTPSAAPNDGIVLTSGASSLISIYEDLAKRVELGALGAGAFGLKGYATNGTTVVFELSDTQQLLAGWSFTDASLYNLVSGTPSVAPNDGLVLTANATPAVIAYEDLAKRAEMGYLSAGVFGFKAYATNGTTVIFEMSDTQQMIAGWVFDDAYMYRLSSGTPTASPNSGIVLNADASPLITIYEGTAARLQLGNLTGSIFGMIGYATDGTTKIFEMSDTQQMIAGWSFTNAQLSSGSVIINATNEQILMGSATAPLTGTGIFQGLSGGAYQMRLGDPTDKYVLWDGTNLTTTGSIITSIRSGSSVIPTPTDANLAGYWSFDEGAGFIAVDSTSNANNGTITGAVFVAGISGTALDFDGVDDVVTITANAVFENLFDGGGATSVWINADTDGEGDSGIIATSQAGWVLQVVGEVAGAMQLRFTQGFSGTNGVWTTTATSITANAWTHVVISYNNGAVGNDPTIYINGTSVAITETTTPVGTRVSDTGNNLTIGNNVGTTATFDGTIDEFRPYTVSLTAPQAISLQENPAGVTSQGIKQNQGRGYTLSSMSRETAGQDLLTGQCVALESNGSVYRTRVTNLATANTLTALALTTPSEGNRHRLISISDTVKLLLMIENGTVRVSRIVVDPESSAITSVGAQTAIPAIASATANMDIIRMTATTAMVSFVGSTGDLRVVILSALDTTITINSETIVSAATVGQNNLVQVSATAAFVYYDNANNDTIATYLTVSGTTITDSGIDNTVSSHVTDVHAARGCVKFDTAETYLFWYRNTTTAATSLRAATNSAGTLTFGTAVTMDFSSGSGQMFGHDTTTALIAYSDNDTSDDIFAREVNVSGTTLTVQTAVTVQSAVGQANGHPTLSQLGTFTYVVAYLGVDTVGPLANNAWRLFEMSDSDAISLLGSEFTIAVGANGNSITMALYHSPTRMMVAYFESSGADELEVRTVDYTHNYGAYIGLVADTNTAVGGTASILLNGRSDEVSGLTAGTEYYADIDGGFVTEAQGGTRRIGPAKSATSIFVQS